MKHTTEEIEIGSLVVFGRELGRNGIGKVEKLNRITYQIRLVEPFEQRSRTYPIGSQFRTTKALVTPWKEYYQASINESCLDA